MLEKLEVHFFFPFLLTENKPLKSLLSLCPVLKLAFEDFLNTKNSRTICG